MHTIDPDQLLCVQLESAPVAARLARVHVREICAGLVADIDDILLVVSELVTNAVKHGDGAPVTLRVTRYDAHLWVAVENTCTEQADLARPWEPHSENPTGRGLFLIAKCSEGLRLHTEPHRTIVEAKFPVLAPPSAR
ncbi:ATP-binding protein [Yinghuangia soli]|uniref:ATP-binding protein n=1 Tax=Yinghuangia soli TaxID=2908204 RepID=A0AA41U4Q1_9ACTN|nr:ATP-binding protein [Yinghuangia soli]MCF2533175.1 ATP-binding protein [Yinghuangia soli]